MKHPPTSTPVLGAVRKKNVINNLEHGEQQCEVNSCHHSEFDRRKVEEKSIQSQKDGGHQAGFSPMRPAMAYRLCNAVLIRTSPTASNIVAKITNPKTFIFGMLSRRDDNPNLF